MAGDLVLITGATGAIGFRTLVRLLEAGYRARVAVRSEASFDKIKDLGPIQRYSSQFETVVVPDITVVGAYDKAVRGVKHVIHIASPTFPASENMDFEAEVIKPAVDGTLGMLNSAIKEPGIQRVVITSSILSLASFPEILSGQVIDESHRTPSPSGPYPAFMMAYVASKIWSFNESEKWVAKHEPSFEVVNIHPTFVEGRDNTVVHADGITKGTNGMIMGPILGNASENPTPGSTVHIDDVAELHVRSLGSDIPGNKSYIANCNPPDGINWADAFDVVKKHFPKECDEGIFKVDATPQPKTAPAKIDSSLAMKTFGITFKSFDEQVISIAAHYLELLGRK